MQKKSNSKSKYCRSILSICLALTFVITCAYAFLTAESHKENTFSIGNVDIELHEEGWEIDKDGYYIRSDGTNEYVEPNTNIEKAPYIENTGKNAAWTYITVAIPTATDADLTESGTFKFDKSFYTIDVTGYAIQQQYEAAKTAKDTWTAYFTDEVKAEHFGKEDVSSVKKYELFKINNLNEDWTLISGPYKTSNYNYYVYSYGLLSKDTSTSALCESVTLLSEPIIEGTVTFAGYYTNLNSENTDVDESTWVALPTPVTLTWDEIIAEKDSDIYHYGSNSLFLSEDAKDTMLEDVTDEDAKQEAKITFFGTQARISENRIGNFTFAGTAVTDITIPSGVTTIGAFAFANTPKLENVVMTNNVDSMDFGAFYYSNLQSITLSQNLQSIEDSVFESCQLTNIKLPDSIQSIGNQAFKLCQITNINLPNSIQSIGDNAFELCPLTSVTLPSSIKTIGDSAFIYNYNLTNVVIPDSIETIGAMAFADCDIREIELPLTEISSSLLLMNDNLSKVTITKTLTSVDLTAFITDVDDISLYPATFDYKSYTDLSLEDFITMIMADDSIAVTMDGTNIK